ncbi:hypothetical protein HMPREF0762_01678 [Slackia exigua ATCC 700122]|uniref:Uncharacterized protein n=1 Tax=Slackia exigua (strain ATCC 700122 / DSM 15923 / CIP 105133 / JCM 11022 / KCTC 5966 / S-7) TaxID=649764 RepID=D0WIK3_SLAES|nr:hypothetical protein HMPREF0762_01678 [Slackia exigua ATCC 700122]
MNAVFHSTGTSASARPSDALRMGIFLSGATARETETGAGILFSESGRAG